MSSNTDAKPQVLSQVAGVPRAKYREADVVVVGAGVFGTAIAFAMANQGRSVLLLERWMRQPDRIVGELLQPGGCAALRKLGLGHCLEGIDAIPCYGFDVIYHGEECRLQYPSLSKATSQVVYKKDAHKYDPEELVQPEGRSFHHGRFINELRKSCLAHPKITVVETDVTKPVYGDHSDVIVGVEARTLNPATGQKEPDYFFGALTIIADGYASKFRKTHLGSTPIVRSRFYALELIDCPLPAPNCGHVIIGNASPVLLYQIGTHETRALIDVPEKLPEAMPDKGGVRNYIKNHVIPTLPAQVRPCMLEALSKEKVLRSMPNSWLPACKQRANGMIMAGDALNMRHPLTGGGMTVAFNDAYIISQLLSPDKVPDLSDTAAVNNSMSEFYWSRKSLTGIINVLAQALYSLFSANNRLLRALQQGCFAYFKMGMTEGPMGLLGGLIHHPMTLFNHFFTVAFLSIWLNGWNMVVNNVAGFVLVPLAVMDLVFILWKASVVFLPVFYHELY
ncbi:Squalene monooxygenase [Ceratocystis fimbriata CBS 114723]|uniref:Squalene monooxygenase n=1 Tax=Ceratocystis fimbriata CBS 114723 TaxID=1035309 RepID=A0A2C5XL04_9PEZI|nr:Squalene monooxygenase [Ceratocystis fimbriata CBS 114723]